jgi:hypothetical protein
VIVTAVAKALPALDAAGVRWCLLRGADQLHRPDGHVEVLVDRRALTGLPELLAGAGFSPARAWGRGPHRFFLDRAGLKLDVVSELAFGRHQELPTRSAEAVLTRRVRAHALWLPAPADAFWALLLHVLLDRGWVRPRRARELVALAPRARGTESPLADVVAAACPAGWDPSRVLDTAAAGRFDELLALVPALRSRWPGSGRVAIAARVAMRAAARRASGQHNGLITSKSRARSAG